MLRNIDSTEELEQVQVFMSGGKPPACNNARFRVYHKSRRASFAYAYFRRESSVKRAYYARRASKEFLGQNVRNGNHYLKQLFLTPNTPGKMVATTQHTEKSGRVHLTHRKK